MGALSEKTAQASSRAESDKAIANAEMAKVQKIQEEQMNSQQVQQEKEDEYENHNEKDHADADAARMRSDADEGDAEAVPSHIKPFGFN